MNSYYGMLVIAGLLFFSCADDIIMIEQEESVVPTEYTMDKASNITTKVWRFNNLNEWDDANPSGRSKLFY